MTGKVEFRVVTAQSGKLIIVMGVHGSDEEGLPIESVFVIDQNKTYKTIVQAVEDN